MKKVRFESPCKMLHVSSDSDCHFPRPFIEKQSSAAQFIPFYTNARVLPYSSDPVKRYDCSDSSPYPVVNKTHFSEISKPNENCFPCNELNLSILDTADSDFKSLYRQKVEQSKNERKPLSESSNTQGNINKLQTPDMLIKHDDFFLKREIIANMNNREALRGQLNNLTLDKENNPILKKQEMMNTVELSSKPHMTHIYQSRDSKPVPHKLKSGICRCCSRIPYYGLEPFQSKVNHPNMAFHTPNLSPCQCAIGIPQCCSHCKCPIQVDRHSTPRNYNMLPTPTSQKTVDQKTWALEKYRTENNECVDVEKANFSNSNIEPTVSDLFKIIKLQSQQLQQLQEKIDNYITKKHVSQPIQNYITERVLDSVSTDQKISIGVMTSFEMVRTSTIINKGVVKQNEAQIQCNRSQISIKEVVSKTHASNSNFLDGITRGNSEGKESVSVHNEHLTKNTEMQDEKTLNEFSLYNVQVDNATTPLMSPEQSMYLDVRDFSDSDSGDDHSNVGWTYYNKVMTHVNGMLQESDMPSSASALYRNTRQKCLQMQIDKTNISVAKRVTFGDEPQQVYINKASSDTSLKMHQLAAKYLKNQPFNNPSPKPNLPVDMSLATKNYMEKHKLLQGPNEAYKPPAPGIPRFLDITALKQQPKLL